MESWLELRAVILAPALHLQLRTWTVPPMSARWSGCRKKGTYGSSSQEFFPQSNTPLRELDRRESTSRSPRSLSRRKGLDLGHNLRAKNLDIARTPQPSMRLKKSLSPLVPGRVRAGVQG